MPKGAQSILRYCPWVPDSVRFTQWPQVFELQAICDKCIQNDLEHYKVKGTNTCICATSTPDSQISLRFSQQRAVSEVHGCQKSQIHWMNSESDWPWTLNGQKYAAFITLEQNFCPLRSTTSCFRNTKTLSKIGNARNELRMTLYTKYLPSEAQFLSASLYDQPCSRIFFFFV